MEETLDTNNQVTSHPQAESKKLENSTSSKPTSQELYNKALIEIKQCFNRSQKSYQAQCIQNIFKRTNYRYLTDLHMHCLVIEIQSCFNQSKTISEKMAVMRMYHEMIVLLERARTYISGVLPIMFVETMGNVKDENMFYFVKELKALYRIWHGYMDIYFLRKIKDQCNMACRMNIMDIDLTDKYLARQISKIKHSQYVAQRIISGNAEGCFPNGSHTYQKKPFHKPKPNQWKRMNNSDKDEILSNQTNGPSEQKEKCETSVNDLDEIPESFENDQGHIQLSKKVERQKDQQKSTQNAKQIDEKATNNKPSISKQANESNKESKQIDIAAKCLPAKISHKGNEKENKSSKLKEMYEKMMMSKRKVGNKILVQSGTWQFSDNIIQILKEKTYKKTIHQIINAEIDKEEEEWIYPEDKFTNSTKQSHSKPFSFSCKFCSLKLEPLTQNGEEYFKGIVLFEISKSEKKRPDGIPCFHLLADTQEEGIFLLHKECFQVIKGGEIDEKKWKLE